MKKKKEQPKKSTTKTSKKSCAPCEVFITSVLVATGILALVLMCRLAYNDIREPSYNTCYMYKDATAIAQIDSIYNDENTKYNLIDLDTQSDYYDNRDTDDFLENYTKLDDCSSYELAKRVVRLSSENRVQEIRLDKLEYARSK